MVLSQPASSTTPSSGFARMSSSTAIAIRLRYNMVVGFITGSPSEITGNSTGKPPALEHASLDVVRKVTQVAVATDDFAPAVEDPDDRPADEALIGEALHPERRAMTQTIQVAGLEPGPAPERAICCASQRGHLRKLIV